MRNKEAQECSPVPKKQTTTLTSGHHGFIKWGHDAKITKIGVIPTGDSPDQGKANSSQDGRQDLGPISECMT